MRRFSLVVFLLGLLIVALLAWQLYGVHHYPKMNGVPALSRATCTVPGSSALLVLARAW